MRNFRSILSIAAGFLAGSRAQSGTLSDLGATLAGNGNLTTFYGLIQKYPQILLKLPSYQGVTILAPNNQAFEKIPYTALNNAFTNNVEEVITNVLEYHILQGTRTAAQLVPGDPVFIPTLLTSQNYTNVTGGQRVENVEQAGNVVVFVSGLGSRSTLTQKDELFTGGVIQVIDSLLIPPSNLTDTLQSFGLLSFEGAAYAAKQMTNLTNTEDVTIFAPNNEAFQALGTAISNMTSKELAYIMEYMVLPQTIYSTGLSNGSQFPTLNGENITITHAGNNVYVNSAQLLQQDIMIANGVLHIVDNVLNPQGPNDLPNLNADSQNVAYASATEVDYLPFTASIPCTVSCPVTTTAVAAGGSTGVSGKTSATSTFSTSKSKGVAAAMARETGFGAAGLIMALGGAVILI